MPNTGLSLGALGLFAAGTVLAYAGVNDPKGGPIGVVTDILAGKMPTPGVQVSTPLGQGGNPNAGTQAIGATIGNVVGDVAKRQKILTVARSYLGIKYVFGGASRSGVDCSGLVLVSYRDGAGISLPHLATAQAARGHKIDRSQVEPGDLIAWGVPGNYPHIALAIDQNTVIVAPHTGTVVQYQALWEKKVSGFGFPDCIRVTGML